MQTVLKHIGYAVGNDLMPLFNDFILVLKDVVIAAKPQFLARLKDAIELLGGAAAFLSKHWNSLVEQIGLLNSAALTGGTGLVGLIARLSLFISQIGLGRIVVGFLLTAIGFKFGAALLGLIAPMTRVIWSLGVATTKMLMLAGRVSLVVMRFMFGLVPAFWAGSRAAFRLAATGIVAVIKGFVALIPSIIGATAAAWGFAVALLANPITWIVAGITALVAAAVWLWNNWDQVSQWLSGAWDTIKSAFSSMMDSLIEALVNFHPLALIMQGINAMLEYLFGLDLGEVGARWMSSISEGIKGSLGEVEDLLSGLATSAFSFFGGDSSGGIAGPALAPAVPSALQNGRTEVGGSILVGFENMPENARIRSANGSGVDVDTAVVYAGRSMSGF